MGCNDSFDKEFTHLDISGRARMVDVGRKLNTERVAEARGSVFMKHETLKKIKANGLEKGDVMSIARVAGIMGSKYTSQLIPLCHTIPLDQVTVEVVANDHSDSIDITAQAKTTAKTGVEMEALTAVTIAALTIYDMCKSVDRFIRLSDIRLVRKTGGRSGDIVFEDYIDTD